MDRSAMIEGKQNRPAVEGVAAVDRALAILAVFRRGDSSLSLADLSERTGLVKSTIMRLAVSLERYGLLVRLNDGSYQLDAEVLRLGVAYQQSFRLEKFVLPTLRDFVARFSETTSFYVRRGEQRQCLFRVESPHLLRLHMHQGDMLPMDSSATAQVLRIFGIQPLPPYAATIELPVRTIGVTDPDIGSLAMPVFGVDGMLAGALTVAAPSTRLTQERVEIIAGAMKVAATELTKALGGCRPDLKHAKQKAVTSCGAENHPTK
jgi:DNA-binding IclR family transcriptional regulator